MAILSNINDLFAIDSSGAIELSGSAGSSGFVLMSNAASNAVSWYDIQAKFAEYLPLTGGDLAGPGNLLVGGTLTVNGITTLNAALTINGRATFPSAIANRPQLPGGFVGLNTGDGNFDIWGISTQYYPSHATAANAWGLQWNGDTNQFRFVGGGSDVVTIDLDQGNFVTTGVITALGGTSTEWNTSYDNSITGLAVTGTTTKTLTATQQDGGTLTASWTDNDSGGTVTGTGTNDYIPKWNAAGTGIENSLLIDTGALSYTTSQSVLLNLKGTSAPGYAEINIKNDVNNFINIGSIGSTYSQVDWTNSAYVYNTGTGRNLWLKSQNDLGLFAGGLSIASNLKVMIKSTGNVGIGEPNPNYKLNIASATNTDGIYLSGTGTSMTNGEYRQIQFGYSDTDTSYGSTIRFVVPDATTHGGQIEFYTDETSVGTLTRAMTIDNSQNVGIGVTGPSYKLQVNGTIGTANRLAIQETYFGYSSGYKVIQLGESAATKAISLGYNPNANTSGSFSGNEILIPNNIRLMAPAASNSGYYALMMLNSSNKMLLGSSNYLIESNYIMALDPATKNVGIGTTSPSTKLEVVTTTSSTAIRCNVGQSSDIFLGFTGANPELLLQDNANIVTHRFESNGDNYIVGSNVGIGTTSPANKIQTKYSPVAIGNLTATNNDSSTTNFNVNAGLLIEDSNTSNGLALGVSGQANDRKSWIQSGHPTSLYGANLGTLSINPLGGNVGIGTISPGYKLQVEGTGFYSGQLTIAGFANDSGISFRQGFNPTNTGIRAKAIASTNRDGTEVLGYNGVQLTVNSGSTIGLTVVGPNGSGLGNVGIGTTAPGHKLEVNGGIRAGIAGNSSANTPGLKVYAASASTDTTAAIAIQQGTAEGDTIIFADYEPHVEWGISAQNSTDQIHFTSGSSTNSLGSKTFYNNAGAARTAYIKFNHSLGDGRTLIGGNLGLGVTSATERLVVAGKVMINNANAPNNLAQLNIGWTGGGETRAIDIDGNWGAGESKSISFTHGSSAIEFVGQINCQHNSPGSRIRWGKLYHNGNSSTYTMELISTTSTTADLTVSGNITASADVTAFSDERLKSNIKTLDGSKVLKMRGVSFEKQGKKGSGVIAQELEKVAPELVKDGEYKSVAYGNLVGYLIEAIKELEARVKELENK